MVSKRKQGVKNKAQVFGPIDLEDEVVLLCPRKAMGGGVYRGEDREFSLRLKILGSLKF